jgi:hypothetical protein
MSPTAELVGALDLPGFNWEGVLALAHRGLVATTLYPALQRRGLLERAPVEVVEHLAALHALSAERNALLRRELARAARVFNALGVEPLLLKGALALVPGESPEIAARLMGDLDLLLPAEAVADGQRALQDRLGYRPAYPESRFAEHHHACPLIHPDHGAKFELHRAVMGRLLEAALPAEDLWPGGGAGRLPARRPRPVRPAPAGRLQTHASRCLAGKKARVRYPASGSDLVVLLALAVEAVTDDRP